MADRQLSESEDVLPYLEEACFYLHKKGLSFHELSRALGISEEDAERLQKDYANKLSKGLAQENDLDKNLWEDIYLDTMGDEKVTFARDDGFYHCRKSDLEKMESPALMAIFETSKKFLDFDMYKRYLDSKPAVGYDPMTLQRQVKRALDLIQSILDTRWREESKKD